jgi:replicative DNA helicase
MDTQELEYSVLSILLTHDDLFYQTELKKYHFDFYGLFFEKTFESKLSHGKINAPWVFSQIAAETGQTTKEVSETLADCLVFNPLKANFSFYQKALIDGYHVRKAQAIAKELLIMASVQGAEPTVLYDFIAKQSMDYLPADDFLSQQEVIQQYFLNKTSGKVTPTGFKTLDSVMDGGMESGKLYCFAGPEKSGKTMFAGTVSGNLNLMGHKHLYVAMEMGAADIEIRQHGRYSQTYYKKLKEPNYDLIKNNVIYSDAAGITWTELQQKMTLAVHKHKVEGVIIDYWQLIKGRNPKETEEYHLREVAQGLADFAKKNKIWVLLLAQVNKQGDVFAGNGLNKACHILISLNNLSSPREQEGGRWLKMLVSRATPMRDLGDENNPYLQIDGNGPFMRELVVANLSEF